MTSPSLASRNGRAVATSGDLVCGLASPVPPQPFVGELGDPAADAAAALVAPLTSAAGHPTPRVPRVAIDGTLLSTLEMRAAPLGGNASAPVGTATTMVGSVVARIGGRRIARQGDASQVTPTSAMAIVGGRQTAVRIAGASVPDAPVASAAGVAQRAIPTRTAFTDPPAAQRILSRCSPARWTSLVPRELAVLVGDPVDVATGAVVTAAIDFASIVPRVQFRRNYASNRCDVDGPLGFGWRHNYDCAIWLEPGRVVLRETDGREIEFDALELPGGVARAGDVLADATGRLRLFCRGKLRWDLRERGRIRQFRAIDGETAHERDRGMARLVRIVREHDLTEELTYDGDARLHEVRVGDRLYFTLQYDEHGRIAALWTPIGERLHRHARFDYSAEGDLTDAVDALGEARAYEYVQHMLVRETSKTGASFHYGYDGFGGAARCVRTWGTGGRLDRVLTYDGSTTVVGDSLGNVTTYRCDALGLVRDVTDAVGDRTRYRYDDALRLVQIVSDGSSVTDTYDERGNLVERRGPGSSVCRMRYDDDDRLVEAGDAMGGTWRYAYDGGGRLTRVEDPLGHVVRLEYENGRLTRIVDPLGVETRTTLDAEGRVVEIAIPSRGATKFEYDELGRLGSVTAPSGERVAWSYDPLNRPTAVETHGETVRFDRDGEGRVVAVHRTTTSTRVRRDPMGSIEALQTGDTIVAFANDSEGRFSSVHRDGALLLSVQRDPRGLVAAYTNGDDEPTLVLRKAKTSRIEYLVERRGATRIDWDDAGRIVAIERPDGVTRRFSWRADGLLVGASDGVGECVIERNARGAVLRQRVGSQTIDTSSVDHAGRRHGLDVVVDDRDRVQISYLRDSDGELERIAVVTDSVHDLRVAHGRGGTLRIANDRDVLEIRRDAWGRFSDAAQPGSALATASVAVDALLRPLRDAAGRALIWDEDRPLLAGDDVLVADPDIGVVFAAIHGDRCELAWPQLDATMPARGDANPDWTAPAIDDAGIEAVCQTPIEMLARRFAHRAWNPEIRPVTSMPVWDPDRWTCRIDGPTVVDGRLDRSTLLRLLGGPFPSAALRLAPP